MGIVTLRVIVPDALPIELHEGWVQALLLVKPALRESHAFTTMPEALLANDEIVARVGMALRAVSFLTA
jgi:hypothetical protein